MPVEAVRIVRRNEYRERPADQLVPIHPEQRTGPQVGLHNPAMLIQREMADRGKFVEFHILVTKAVTHRCNLRLGTAELVVLHFQLDLVNLQLVYEMLHVLARHRRNVALGRQKPRFRLPAELRHLRRFARFLGHHIARFKPG